MRLPWIAVIFFSMASMSCSEKPASEEPVAVQDDAPPLIPDLPGQAAGQGQADASAAATSDAAAAADANNVYYVTSHTLNVRSGPGMSHPVVDYLRRGASITVLEESGIWLKIGESRFVSNKHVSPDKTQ